MRCELAKAMQGKYVQVQQSISVNHTLSLYRSWRLPLEHDVLANLILLGVCRSRSAKTALWLAKVGSKTLNPAPSPLIGGAAETGQSHVNLLSYVGSSCTSITSPHFSSTTYVPPRFQGTGAQCLPEASNSKPSH
jgi:hypothetical protein